MLVPTRHGAIALVLLAVALLFLPAAGLRDWWYPDEPDVALPAIEMQVRGDWVVPTHNGTPWLDYPPLAFWSSRLVGLVSGEISPFGTRLPMVLFACVLVFATVRIGGRLLDQRSALVASIVLISTPIFWFHSTNLQVDLGFVAFQTAGLALYVAGDARVGMPSIGYRIAAFACFGVAILGKGPLGVLLPGLILTCWHAWNREWRRLLELAPLSLAALLVALPWYLFLSQRLGADYVLHQLYLQNFDRFGQSNRGHGGKGFWYYFTTIPVDLGFWSVLMFPVLLGGFAVRKTDGTWKSLLMRCCAPLVCARQDRAWRLLIIWVIAPVVFFTFASTKRNVYLLPIFPAMALLIADWLMHADSGWKNAWKNWAARAVAGVLLSAGALLLVLASAWPYIPLVRFIPLAPDAIEALRMPAIVLGVWLVLASYAAFRGALANRLEAWFGIAATCTIGYSLAMWLVLPVIDRGLSYKPAAHWVAQWVPVGGEVGFFSPGRESTKRPSWLCHLGGNRRLVFLASPEAALSWLAADPKRVLLTEPRRQGHLTGVVVTMEWKISSDYWAMVSIDRSTPQPSTPAAGP